MRISDWSSDVCSSDLFVLASLLGLARDSNLYQLGMILTFLVIILVTLRALFQPLILRYGGPAGDDTHGSARFATDRETRPLAQNGDGLLIGRDRKSGKPQHRRAECREKVG